MGTSWISRKGGILENWEVPTMMSGESDDVKIHIHQNLNEELKYWQDLVLESCVIQSCLVYVLSPRH